VSTMSMSLSVMPSGRDFGRVGSDLFRCSGYRFLFFYLPRVRSSFQTRDTTGGFGGFSSSLSIMSGSVNISSSAGLLDVSRDFTP